MKVRMGVMITKGITIATFISNNEKDSKEIYDVIHFLENNFNDIEVIVFSDYDIKNKSYRIDSAYINFIYNIKKSAFLVF